MPANRTRLRVFVASPSDVAEERQRVSRAIAELNRGIADEKGVYLEEVKWETHVAPDMGRPQQVILDQIQPEDIFVGIMWHRFGTPTGEAQSGTEEEFELAYKTWKKSGGPQGGRPRIMFYFCNRGVSLAVIRPEKDQFKKVLAFQSRIYQLGFASSYTEPEEFEAKLREHLTNVIRHWRPPGTIKPLAASATKLIRRWRRQARAIARASDPLRFEGPEPCLAYCDIEGFSRLNRRLGMVACDQLRDDYVRMAIQAIEQTGGVFVHGDGDEILAAFTQPVDGARFSLEFQELLRSADVPYQVRIGLHDVVLMMFVVEGERLLWGAARRACDLSKLGRDGSILATERVAKAAPHVPWRSAISWRLCGENSLGPVWQLCESGSKKKHLALPNEPKPAASRIFRS